MKFKGDIIITDPCYIISEKKIGIRPLMTDYPELARVNGNTPFKDYTPSEKETYDRYHKTCREWEELQPNDWKKCEYGQRMQNLGIHTFLTRDTEYGDWSCTTYNADTKEKIGQFCADAGLVSVFLLEEVLKYNPEFDYHIKRPWTTTLIKDFDGEIEIKVVDYTYTDSETGQAETDTEVRVIGKGNINFFTTQTGL